MAEEEKKLTKTDSQENKSPEEKKEAPATEEKAKESKENEATKKPEEKAVVEKAQEQKKEAKEIEAKSPAVEKSEVEIEVPKGLKKIVETIENLKVVELAQLVKVLEKKFGVSAVAPMAQPPAAGAGEASGEEEKKFFNIVLTAIGEKKIEVIKVVRDVTQRGLKEAKDLVDGAAAGPQVIQENVKADEAKEIKKKLEEAGASVELK
jgi:large subunit ribosomal protein L7/L12